MDGNRFDALTRLLGRGATRRGATAIAAILAGAGLADFRERCRRSQAQEKEEVPQEAMHPAAGQMHEAVSQVLPGFPRQSALVRTGPSVPRIGRRQVLLRQRGDRMYPRLRLLR